MQMPVTEIQLARTAVVMLTCVVLVGLGCAQAPDSPQLMLERAKILMDRGQGAEAIQLLDRILEVAPDDPEACFHRGLAYESLDLPEKALADYVACLKLDGMRTDALNNKAVQLAKLKRFDEAIVTFSEVVDLDPEDFLGYRNRGLCRFDMQDNAGALEDYATALQLNSEDPSSWYQRGNVHLAMNTLDAAESDFSTALELDPEFAKAWMNRGVTRYRRGEKALAAEDLAQAQKLDSNIVLPGLDFFKDPDPAVSAGQAGVATAWQHCRPVIERDLTERGFSALVFAREYPDFRCAELTAEFDGVSYKVLVACQQHGQSTITLPCPDPAGDSEPEVRPCSLLVLQFADAKETPVKIVRFEQNWNPEADAGEPVIMNYPL